MPKVAFLGRVFPVCYQVNMAHSNPLEWIWREENLVLRFDLRIEKSKVRIECTLDTYKPEYRVEIHRRSFDIVRSAVNLAAFCSGVGYSVVFEHFVDVSGSQSMFSPQDPSLAPLCTSFSLDPGLGKTPFGKMWDIVVADPAGGAYIVLSAMCAKAVRRGGLSPPVLLCGSPEGSPTAS
jgi:hypothetical protein